MNRSAIRPGSGFRVARRAGALASVALLATGCAGTANNPNDPFEGYNRAAFSFNDKVDQIALKPAATAYRKVTPSFVQTGVGNFFGNISDIWSTVNLFLQGKLQQGFDGFTRVALNTSFGLGGILDFASDAGLQKHNEDLGQTLGYWGVPSGPYLVLPLFGPSTVRDAVALPGDLAGNLWTYKEPLRWRNVGIGVRVIDERAALLDAGSLLEAAALDKYQFVRDAYLQRRASQVNDGARPDDEDNDAEAPAVHPAQPGAGGPVR
ncbi:MAG: MlaA family lipoprotein [Burkholderiaceae bacterium]